MGLRKELANFIKEVKFEINDSLRIAKEAFHKLRKSMTRPTQVDNEETSSNDSNFDNKANADTQPSSTVNEVFEPNIITEDEIINNTPVSDRLWRTWKLYCIHNLKEAWRILRPFIIWYVKLYLKISLKIVRFLLWPFRKVFPYKLQSLFYYDFEQLFLNRTYWKEVMQALFPRVETEEFPYMLWLFLLCMISPASAWLAMACYRWAFDNLKLRDAKVDPVLNGQPRLLYVAMIFGAMVPLYIGLATGAIAFFLLPVILIWGIANIASEYGFGIFHTAYQYFIFFLHLIPNLIHNMHIHMPKFMSVIFAILVPIVLFIVVPILLIAFLITWVSTAFALFKASWFFFEGWRHRIYKYHFDVAKHGTARFATEEDLKDSLQSDEEAKGIYIGNGQYYDKRGHILTVAGTRGGKGVNLIIPNLTKVGRFEGSFLIVDPKGENAAVTARIQAEKLGRKVIILNPWDLLVNECPHLKGSSYNPLDLLTNKDDDNFVDDASIIAEMIIPISKAETNKDTFWDDRARSLVAGFIMHIADKAPKDKKNLTYLYEVTRLAEDELDEFLIQMAGSTILAVRAVASEIIVMRNNEKMYSAIMASVFSNTDFIKSPPLQRALLSTEFKMSDLMDGNTAVYVIIPADKLTTHKQWLRLIVTTALRTVIRNPNKDVCFLLDEYYALDYISEVDTALGTYAGYGVHIWAILQNLNQLADMHGKHWEGFMSSCSIRHFFNISDNFSTGYISQMFGQTTHALHSRLGFLDGAEGRLLINPDELRIASGKEIFTVIDQNYPARFAKRSYLDMPELIEGEDYDANPYHKKRG